MSPRIRSITVVLAFLLVQTAALHAQTTVTAESSNNTAAYDHFTDSYYNPHNPPPSPCTPSSTPPPPLNGDLKASNVSKVSARELLFDPAHPNAANNTHLLVELQSWFRHNPNNTEADGTINPCASIDLTGTNSHADIGYTSNDPAQVASQIADMKSRGYEGALFDWNGTKDSFATTMASNLMTASEQAGAFIFGIIIDKQAFILPSNQTDICRDEAAAQIKNKLTATVIPDCTTRAIAQINFVVSNYAGSPAYIRTPGGRPIVGFFVDTGTPIRQGNIDWNSVRANVSGNPYLIGDRASAYGVYDGAYGWMGTSDPASGGYGMDFFYKSAAANPSAISIGAVFKGFDDTLAAWGGSRKIVQNCGQTWLDLWAHTRTALANGDPIPWVQAVTWDDYEEGTEIESGIDNCLQTLSPSISANMLTWSPGFGFDRLSGVQGTENTVHHYQVYAAQSGTQQLTLLADNVHTHQYDLSQAGLAAGNYDIYVKAVGQPNIVNVLSTATAYSPAPSCGVKITSPANGTSVTSPVQVTATATPLPGATVVSIEIDVDGTSVFSAPNTSSVDQPVSIASSGSHTITVKATQSDGSICASSVTITIPVPDTGVTVNVTSPTQTTNPIPSPVTFSATASSLHTITGWHIYVDNADVFGATNVSSISTKLKLSAGAHTVIIRAWDSTGVFGDQTLNITVDSPTVTVSSPADGATVTSPTVISASATSSAAITGWHIYVDGVDKFGGSMTVNSISPSISMTPGTHTVIVRAWDSTGAFGDVTLTLNVVGVQVTVSAPANNATVSSPVTISASATSGSPITGWHIYVDDADVFGGSMTVTSISQSIAMDAGTHTVIVRAWDSTGAFGDQTLTINVTGVTLTLSTPLNNATVTSPVRVVASATSSHPITGWHIYVDGSDVYGGTLNVSSIDTNVTMATGTHTVVVRAWDSTGANDSQTLTLNVANGVTVHLSSPTATTVNSPVTISASATSGHPITGWHIYVDGVDSYGATNVSSISTSLTMAVGQHDVIVRAWDSTGAFGDQEITLNVVSGVTVTLSQPSTTSPASPVPIAASAVSAHTITAWHIYVDGTDVFGGAMTVSSISTSVAMSSGSHTVVVRAWDSTGAFGDRTVKLTVQ